MADQNGIPSNIGNLTGPPFLGIFLNGYLFGILTLQYYTYCSDFRNDKAWLRNLVHIQFLLEAAQTAMSVADGFYWFVYGYGNLNKLGDFYLANFDSPILCSIIALISQGVYCWRIYHLSRWKVATFVIVLTACCQVVGGFGIGIVNQRLGNIRNWDDKYNVFVILWSVCTATTDTLIAGIMVFLLVSAPHFSSSKTVMTKLIRLVIETNLASALVAITSFLTTVIPSVAPPKTSYFLCPGYVLGKLYSNSFITMLNNRRPSGGEQDGPSSSFGSRGESVPGGRPHLSSPSRRLKHGATSSIAVAIHRETDVHIEGGTKSQDQTTDSITKQ